MKITAEELVAKNDLALNRNAGEIRSRIDSSTSMFGFGAHVLMEHLPWERAKDLYKDEFVKKVEDEDDEQKAPEVVTDVLAAAAEFIDYMEFAWDKAVDRRGLSAGRSIEKLGAWLWLMGRDDLRRLINDDELYNPYGAPALIAVCDRMGIEVPDDVREFAGNPV